MSDAINYMSSTDPLAASSLLLYFSSMPSVQYTKISVFEYAKKSKAILEALNSVSTFDGTSISVDAFVHQVTSLFHTIAVDEEMFIRLLIVNRLKGRALAAFDSAVTISTLDVFVNTLLFAFKYTS